MNTKYLILALAVLALGSDAQARRGEDDHSEHSSSSVGSSSSEASSSSSSSSEGSSSSASSSPRSPGQKSCRRSRTVNQRFVLEPTAGFEVAKVKSRLSSSSTSCNDVSTINKIEGRVKLPIPSAGLAISDLTAATSAKLHYVFSRAGVDYADCQLVVDSDDDNESRLPTRAEYKFALEMKKNGSVRNKKGNCDTNLATVGVQKGMPSLQTGDTVRAEVEIGSGRVKFAEDTL